MTAPAQIEILADHSVWLAVPAFAPAFVVAGIVIYIAAKNRRKDAGTNADHEGTP